MLSTKKSHHNILDEKLPIFSSVLLFGFYMVFEGSLQQALHRFVTFKRIFFVLKSRNAGCWCLSKKMDEQCVAIKIVAMQLFYKLIIFDSKCSSKFKQQLHESHISAFIFHTWAIRLDCDRVFWGGDCEVQFYTWKRPEWPFIDELMWKVWVGDDCLRRFLLSPYTHTHFAHTVLGSCFSKSGHIGRQCEGNRSPSTALQCCFIMFAEVQLNIFCRR